MTTTAVDAALDLLASEVDAASRIVAPSWPMSSTIAVNPLAGYEHLPFSEAVARGEERFGGRGLLTFAEYRAAHRHGRIQHRDLVEAVRRQVPEADVLPPVTGAAGRAVTALEVLTADLLHGPDATTPVGAGTEVGSRGAVESAVDRLAVEHCLEVAVRPGGPAADEAEVRAHLRTLHRALDGLGVEPDRWRSHLEAEVAALPGWSAHLRWRDREHGSCDLLEYLARRATLEVELGEIVAETAPLRSQGIDLLAVRTETAIRALGVAPNQRKAVASVLARLDGSERRMVWQDAFERSLHDPLLAAIATSPAGGLEGEPPLAHLVACIDVRSEGLRRALESTGPYRTFGYAGFFGLPVRLVPTSGRGATDQCPVLIHPSRTVTERAEPGSEEELARRLDHRDERSALDHAWHAAKHHPIAPLALAEASGWVLGPAAALRTAAPGLAARLADRLDADRRALPVGFDRSGLSLDEQAAVVAGIWRLGLADPIAPIIVLCGHASRADNNPMESGLACGACAGHSGGPNARIAAAMANDPNVRAKLRRDGIDIPDATWFVAAEHDTATDVVTLFDVDAAPESHRRPLSRLTSDLGRASEVATLDRARWLPGLDRAEPAGRDARNRRLRAVRRRSRDWAEPVAELGLAGNAAFVVGPRSITRSLDLRRRVFLHSYDVTSDADGTVLAGILTAPLVVAQWINAQYHFSTTDPEVYGSGSKAVHNPVGDIGVLSGPGGDLRRGLALQSVRDGDRLVHEPVRLLAVVQGRLDHIDRAIEGSETLRDLVHNGWILLVARERDGDPWLERHGPGWAPREIGSRTSSRDAAPWPEAS